ncbi:Succinate-semialdehyde dehydrogenase, mitochondrial, partial [Desmophyllum pertusum]
MRARLPCPGWFVRGMALFRSSGYIGGKWQDCEATFPVYNPATGEELGRVADMEEKKLKRP